MSDAATLEGERHLDGRLSRGDTGPRAVERAIPRGNAPATVRRRSIVFVVADGFSMLELALALEPLSLANALLGCEAYRWATVASEGGARRASNGCRLRLPAEAAADTATPTTMVCLGSDEEQAGGGDIGDVLNGSDPAVERIVVLRSAVRALAETDFADEIPCALHWQDLPVLERRHPRLVGREELYHAAGKVHTCAGGTATLDLMLHLIRTDQGQSLADRICEHLLVDRIRSADDRQRRIEHSRYGAADARLARAIELMEANLGTPLPLDRISRSVRMSRRQLERLFRGITAVSPGCFYLRLRLREARNFLQSPDIAVAEAAASTGFVSASHFAKAFKDFFGCSPNEARGRDWDEKGTPGP